MRNLLSQTQPDQKSEGMLVVQLRGVGLVTFPTLEVVVQIVVQSGLEERKAKRLVMDPVLEVQNRPLYYWILPQR